MKATGTIREGADADAKLAHKSTRQSVENLSIAPMARSVS